MIFRDPKCVFVANNATHASVVVNWLEHQGVAAQVMDRMTFGGLEGLTVWTGASSRGIEIWVMQETDIEPAKTLIAEHEQEISSLVADKAAAGPVTARCEECGRTTRFPGEHRGTVQDCPHCGEYVDVPDDDGVHEPPRESQTDGRAGPEIEPAAVVLGGESKFHSRLKQVFLVLLGLFGLLLLFSVLQAAVSFFR
jgi:hypothetical protein